jgi:membrane protein implicated in regulation of membrane protease activity
MLLEFATPGLVIVFFGIGAWITSLFVFLFGFKIDLQLIIFVITSVASLIILRKYLLKKLFKIDKQESDELLNEFIGQVAVAESEINSKNQGRVNYNGTSWVAESDFEIKKNQKVEIINTRSTVLIVKPV